MESLGVSDERKIVYGETWGDMRGRDVGPPRWSAPFLLLDARFNLLSLFFKHFF